MTEQDQPTPAGAATPDEKQRAAEAESYGGVPMDDQELADVWTGPERVGFDSAPKGEAGAADATDQQVDRSREAEEAAAGEPPD